MNDKIWLSSPHMGGTELKYIHEAFDANWVAPLGPNVNGFEDDIRTYLKQDAYIAALSAGTAALHLALIECGVTPGESYCVSRCNSCFCRL
jgi:dTDP-4-amino-4,6-dideoxygalactose transaminase